jgi:hypothetical protein
MVVEFEWTTDPGAPGPSPEIPKRGRMVPDRVRVRFMVFCYCFCQWVLARIVAQELRQTHLITAVDVRNLVLVDRQLGGCPCGLGRKRQLGQQNSNYNSARCMVSFVAMLLCLPTHPCIRFCISLGGPYVLSWGIRTVDFSTFAKSGVGSARCGFLVCSKRPSYLNLFGQNRCPCGRQTITWSGHAASLCPPSGVAPPSYVVVYRSGHLPELGVECYCPAHDGNEVRKSGERKHA